MKKKVRAVTKNVRISPRKARLAAGLIRGLFAEDALLQLKYSPLKGARLIKKTLKSAVANGINNLESNIDFLKVSEVRIDEGPTMKRAKSKNRGGRVPVMKRTSHITVVLTIETERRRDGTKDVA